MGVLMLALIPFAWRVGIVATAVVALVIGYAYWHHEVYQAGYDAAIAAVAAENKEAVDAADQLRAKRHECINSGGTWSVIDGVCQRP